MSDEAIHGSIPAHMLSPDEARRIGRFWAMLPPPPRPSPAPTESSIIKYLMPHRLGNDPAEVSIVPDWIPPQIDPEYRQNRMNSRQMAGMARSALGKIARQMIDNDVQTLKQEMEQIGAGTPTPDASATYVEQARDLSRLSRATEEATDSNAAMFDSLYELDLGAGDLSGTMDLAMVGMDGMNASMGMGAQEALAYAGQMGTLEDKFLTLTQAADGLKHTIGSMPTDWALTFAPPPEGGGTGKRQSAGGWDPPAGVSAHADPTELDAIAAEKQRIRNMPPAADLEDLFLAQEDLGHNISLYASPEAWWEAHKQELANNVRGYASGTHFAPGGMALVGEMGPELVNLPRGSQVIPNPQLGSAVTVNVTVEGSVVAERDLAQRIRQELIRTSRRTVDLGFVS